MLLNSMVSLSSVSRRRFLKSAGVLGLTSIALERSAALSSLEGPIEVSRHTVTLRHLPDPFHKLKIVQLSDIHHSSYVSFNEVYRMVEITNQEQPDLVFLTGDYVTWSRKYIRPVAEALKNVKSRFGVYAVLGNHDFRVDADLITASLGESRIDVLRNASRRIDFQQQSLWIAGVDEYSYGRSDLGKALAGIPASQPRILLAHHPEILPLAARHQVDFVFSGHTHGGQIKIPYLGSLNGVAANGQNHASGFIRYEHTRMYVSRGLGKVVLPFRLFCPPELPVFNLVKSA
jgi:uncharacterized protein